jgi:hypothetical protein
MPFTSFRLVSSPYLAGLALHERLSLGQEVTEEKGVMKSIPKQGKLIQSKNTNSAVFLLRT